MRWNQYNSPPSDIWQDTALLYDWYTTNNHAVRISPQPGVLVASILVSILGSYATLLVLGRRTSSRGLPNMMLLLLAALCFACVAVWGMHFVGMISIRLEPSPDTTWYLTFSAGMTCVSLFVPLVSTSLSFWFLGGQDKFIWWRGLVSGVLCGLTIVFMHYSAAMHMPHFSPTYTAVTVVFAIVLACLAATVALGLFFRLREQWQDSFWKRGACSIVLATAVCGMHYLGVSGASYHVKKGVANTSVLENKSQSTRLTIAISVMCGAIILLCVVIAVVDYLIRRDIRAKARNIVVASASFDSTGKLLVRHDGTIPMQIIQTDADLQRVLGELDPRRPTFQWLYQMSFNWDIITPFVPRILREVASRGKKVQPPPTSDRSMNRSAWEQLLFRSRFIEACVLLAHQLDLSIESLGVMFDRVMTTGTRSNVNQDEPLDDKSVRPDDESSIHGITLSLNTSEGVMLFIVRTIGNGQPASHDVPGSEKQIGISHDNIDSYLTRGYRLTETRFFSKTLADNMGVSKQEMDVFLSACKTYAKRGTRPVVQPGGAYLGLFGVRPASDGGLDVLVYNFARHQIPAYRLPDVGYPLPPAMRAFVRECTNLTMAEVLQRCNDAVQEAEASDNESNISLDETLYEFQAAIAVAVEALTTALRCWPDLQVTARLSSEILDLPTSESDDKLPAQMIVFEIVLGAPEARITPVQSRASGVQAPGVRSGRADSDKPPAPFVYTPYSLFTKSQTMLIRARGAQEYYKSTQSDLARLYPFVANDVAAEVHEEDSTVQSSPSEKRPPSARWDTRKLKLSKGLSVQTGATLTEVGATSLESAAESGEYTYPPSSSSTGLTGYAASPGVQHRSARSGLIQDDMSQPGTDFPEGSTAEYRHIRGVTEGWHTRSMATMERNDTRGLLQGVDVHG